MNVLNITIITVAIILIFIIAYTCHLRSYTPTIKEIVDTYPRFHGQTFTLSGVLSYHDGAKFYMLQEKLGPPDKTPTLVFYLPKKVYSDNVIVTGVIGGYKYIDVEYLPKMSLIEILNPLVTDI